MLSDDFYQKCFKIAGYALSLDVWNSARAFGKRTDVYGLRAIISQILTYENCHHAQGIQMYTYTIGSIFNYIFSYRQHHQLH